MSSSQAQRKSEKPEQGDYLIDFHLSYVNSVAVQAESYLRGLADTLKIELVKMKSDGDFIKEKLPPPFKHLVRLKQEDRDIRDILDQINTLADHLRVLGQKSANRIL